MFEVICISFAFLGLAVRQISLPPLVGFLVAGFAINAAGPSLGLPDYASPVLETSRIWACSLAVRGRAEAAPRPARPAPGRRRADPQRRFDYWSTAQASCWPRPRLADRLLLVSSSPSLPPSSPPRCWRPSATSAPLRPHRHRHPDRRGHHCPRRPRDLQRPDASPTGPCSPCPLPLLRPVLHWLLDITGHDELRFSPVSFSL